MTEQYEEWEESPFYGDEKLLANGYTPDSEEALEAPKERSKWRIHYMARHVGGKPQILQLAGKKYMDVYTRRGFVEIDRAEYDRLVKVVKGL
jgi:hypothetical protein